MALITNNGKIINATNSQDDQNMVMYIGERKMDPAMEYLLENHLIFFDKFEAK
jgi:hypothetical protein